MQMVPDLIKAVQSAAMWYLCFAMWFVWLYHKWLKKPVALMLLRCVCLLACVGAIMLSLTIVVHLVAIIKTISSDAFNLIPVIVNGFFVLLRIGFLLICYFIFRKPWWYYITKSKQTILADWYMRKSFEFSKEGKHEEAHQFLLKASELKKDSVYIWSMLAQFTERFNLYSPAAEEYLAKAREVLKTSPQPAWDQAQIESVTGSICLYRNNVDEGLAHLKAACDLDSSDFHKKKYQHALDWANQPDDEDDSPEPEIDY